MPYQTTYLPTLHTCRDTVREWTREKLLEKGAFYAERLTHDLRDPRYPARPRLIAYYEDMRRAIDDEPGDLIDFGC